MIILVDRCHLLSWKHKLEEGGNSWGMESNHTHSCPSHSYQSTWGRRNYQMKLCNYFPEPDWSWIHPIFVKLLSFLFVLRISLISWLKVARGLVHCLFLKETLLPLLCHFLIIFLFLEIYSCQDGSSSTHMLECLLTYKDQEFLVWGLGKMDHYDWRKEFYF